MHSLYPAIDHARIAAENLHRPSEPGAVFKPFHLRRSWTPSHRSARSPSLDPPPSTPPFTTPPTTSSALTIPLEATASATASASASASADTAASASALLYHIPFTSLLTLHAIQLRFPPGPSRPTSLALFVNRSTALDLPTALALLRPSPDVSERPPEFVCALAEPDPDPSSDVQSYPLRVARFRKSALPPPHAIYTHPLSVRSVELLLPRSADGQQTIVSYIGFTGEVVQAYVGPDRPTLVPAQHASGALSNRALGHALPAGPSFVS